MTWLRRFSKRTRAAAIVEFALVVPIFFMIVLGIIQFSRAYARMNALTAALREGSRTASTLDPSKLGATARRNLVMQRI